MLVRLCLALALALFAVPLARAQTQTQRAAPRTDKAWQPSGEASRSQPPEEDDVTPVRTVSNERGIAGTGTALLDTARRQIARVSAGSQLPVDDGQVWKNYDIQPYTL